MASAAFTIDQDNGEHPQGPSSSALPLRDAIIFVKRSVVKSVVTRELQKFGIGEMHTMDSANATIRQLKEMPHALLVIDWEHGEESVVQVLQAAQGTYKVDTRPIYFLASELSPKLVSIASDYNIIQIHVGEITPKDIQAELSTITSFSYLSAHCQQIFHETAVCRSQGEWKKAEGLLQKLQLAEPTNIRVGLELGENYFETADYDAATDIIDRMLAIDPNNMRARHIHARILLKRGDHEQAMALLEDLCERGTLNLDRLVDLGQCLISMDRADDAAKQFDKALKLDGESKRASAGKSQCDLLLGNINEAVLLMRQIADDKEVAAIFNNTAIICIRRGQYEKGLSLYQAAVSQVGENPAIQARITFNMGIGYLRWSKKPEACLAFTRALELDASFTKARHNVLVLSKGNLLKAANKSLPTDAKQQNDDVSIVVAGEEGLPDLGVEALKLLHPESATKSPAAKSPAAKSPAAKSPAAEVSNRVVVEAEKKPGSMPVGIIKKGDGKKPNPDGVNDKHKTSGQAKVKQEIPAKAQGETAIKLSSISDDLQDVVPDATHDSIFDELDEDFFESVIET